MVGRNNKNRLTGRTLPAFYFRKEMDPLKSFFLELTVTTTAVIAVVISLLEFLIALVAVISISTSVAVTAVFTSETLDKGGIRKFKLTAGNIGQFGLDSVVVYGFLVPVIICQ